MSIKALQDYTVVSKYSRYNRAEKRRETWAEANDRVKNMHLRKYPQAAEHIEWAFQQVKAKRVLGSARALQFGGEPVERVNARLYNCCASYCDRLRFFQESFWLLLCGSGVGFSVQKHHIAKFPGFVTRNNPGTKRFLIPDSIEGWADALGVLLASYFPGHPDFSAYEGYEIEFDYSLIRAEGSPISSGSGKAPGPEPLRCALEKIRELLERCVAAGQERLRPIDAYDIVMHASDAVLSGGVRRSATICLFSPDDEEMAAAKTGNWFTENPQRGRSNNSALLIRNKTTKKQFLKLMELVKQFGEPGFIWADDTETIFNPCVEISLYAVDEVTGQSGWQFCNLCEINGKKVKSKEDFALAAKAAAIIGTLQAGYTDFKYLGPVTERITRREALLGVSITGIQDSPDILLQPDLQRQMAALVLDTNDWMAELIGINPCARGTCVKPAGTSSCVLGSASGIHPHHYRRYFRLVQGNRNEAPLQFFKRHNPMAVEKSVWSANGTDEVIRFCIEVPDGLKTKFDQSAVDLLKDVKLTQSNWVDAGKRPGASAKPWLRHNVSNTVNVRPEEWDEVADFIYENRQYFAGISLLPMSGDKDYPQAPFTAVYTPREIVQMYGDGSLMASGLIVDALRVFPNLWKACDAALGIDPLTEPVVGECPDSGEIEFNPLSFTKYQTQRTQHMEWEEKSDWVRRLEQFAERYCDNDVRKCTYLLKDVSNWKLWCDLQREYQDVDYTQMFEDTDETKPMAEIACAGGLCDIVRH